MISSAQPKAAHSGKASAAKRLAAMVKQRGAATLFLSVIILFMVTMVTFYANKGAVFEQRVSANQYAYTRAYEAAQGGVDYSMAWLSVAGVSGVNNFDTVACSTALGCPSSLGWVVSAVGPFTHANTTALTAAKLSAAGIPGGSFAGAVAVTLRSDSSHPWIIGIEATASGDSAGTTGGAATVTQVLNVNGYSLNSLNQNVPPLVVNGCISAVTGTPDIFPLSGVDALSSSNPACLQGGNFNLHGGTLNGNGFTGTAWDYVFGGLTKLDMQAMASLQPGGITGGPIYYYTDATVPNTWNTNLGTNTAPVILIFDVNTGSCPKLNGGVNIYGIVYCAKGLDMQGWGGANIYGSVISDTDITKFTANTQLVGDANLANNLNNNIPPVVKSSSKIAGAWRDF